MQCTPPEAAEGTCEEVGASSSEAGSGAGEVKEHREEQLGRESPAGESDLAETTTAGAMEDLHNKAEEDLATGEAVEAVGEEEEATDSSKVEPSKGDLTID